MNQIESIREAYRVREAIGADVERRQHTDVEDAASRLRTAAAGLHRVAEYRCNGVRGPDGHMKWDDEDEARAEATERKAMRKAEDALVTLVGMAAVKDGRVHWQFQGDPRGAMIVVLVDGRRVASW